eukprot:GHVP01036740.1.p1 GENE.GHVP01036740.1~~GHVP01036740.1.p1  ORF type:complete len:898 (+),score=188.33 GHVP01036740.1:61-2754(+)
MAEAPQKDITKKEEEPLSAEDAEIEENVSMLVSRITEPNEELAIQALNTMESEVRSSSSSMTSVPKTIRFLRNHFQTLVDFHFQLKESSPLRPHLSDILSVLSTSVPNDQRYCLKFRLLGTEDSLTKWGHEYIRFLSVEIIEEFQSLLKKNEDTTHLMNLVDQIIPHSMLNNSETHAADLLLEVDAVEKLIDQVDKNTYHRVTLYLASMAPLSASSGERERILMTSYKICLKFEDYTNALINAFRMNQDRTESLLTEILSLCKCPIIRSQLALMCSKQTLRHTFSWDGDENLKLIANGSMTSKHFLELGKELDLMKPKLPEDAYKNNLEFNKKPVVVDSAMENLGATIVNGFMNMAFGPDELISSEAQKWLFRNAEAGMTTAAASLGLLHLWQEDSLAAIEKCQYAEEINIQCGGLMAFGISSANVDIQEMDQVFEVLKGHMETEDAKSEIILGASIGLGFAFAGRQREDVRDLLVPIIVDPNNSVKEAGFAALSLALCFVGSSNSICSQAIIQAIIERSDTESDSSYTLEVDEAILFPLALGCLFLGRCEDTETNVTLETLQAVTHPIGELSQMILDGMSHMGSGDVVKLQTLLSGLTEENKENEEAAETNAAEETDAAAAPKKEDKFLMAQLASRVLLLPFIAIGEETGSEMVVRLFDHLLQYGNQNIRRAVPLAIAFINVSNPKPSVVDTLSKLSHDSDKETSTNAIICLGLVGAGTNNAKIATLLRQLATHHQNTRDNNALLATRVAQGFLYMAKGLCTLSPLQFDRTVLKPTSLAGISIVFFLTLLMKKEKLLKQFPYALFYSVLAASPRHLVTLNETLESIPLATRVGKAVDIVGQAGSPKTITGFQTFTTPVVLTTEERAELATDEYTPYSTCLEGAIIVRHTPVEEQKS